MDPGIFHEDDFDIRIPLKNGKTILTISKMQVNKWQIRHKSSVADPGIFQRAVGVEET